MTDEAAKQLAVTLTYWYYHKGGILFTAKTRDAFFAARDALDEFQLQNLDLIVQRFSALRTALCEDLNSREGPTFTVDGDQRKPSSSNDRAKAKAWWRL